MNDKIDFLSAKQVRDQLDNPTTATIKWDVPTVRFPIASDRRLTIQGNKVVFEEEHSYIENRNGYKTELVVQGNVHRLRASASDGTVDSKLLCASGRCQNASSVGSSRVIWCCGEFEIHAAFNIREELICRHKLMGQRPGFDVIHEIHQKLIGTNTTQRIFRSGVCVSSASLEMPGLPRQATQFRS